MNLEVIHHARRLSFESRWFGRSGLTFTFLSLGVFLSQGTTLLWLALSLAGISGSGIGLLIARRAMKMIEKEQQNL